MSSIREGLKNGSIKIPGAIPVSRCVERRESFKAEAPPCVSGRPDAVDTGWMSNDEDDDDDDDDDAVEERAVDLAEGTGACAGAVGRSR